MKWFSLKTLRSSFWFWFVAVLSVNQLILFLTVFFVALKPASEYVGRVIGTAVEASAVAIQQDPQHGPLLLQTAVAGFQVIGVDVGDTTIEPIPPYYLGYRIIQTVLEKQEPNLHVGYTSSPVPTLLVQSSNLPGMTMRVAFGGSPFILRVLGLMMLLMLLFSALAAFWISARLVQPLHDLSAAADRLGRDKDFRRIHLLPGSSREVSQLADKLNEMRAALDASMQEREGLLAGVAHDLRTPLSRMRIAIELEGDKNAALTDGLRDDVIEMAAVMEQFIELSRLNLEVDEPWVLGDLNQLLRDVQVKYRRGGIELLLNLANALPPIRQKPLALTRLLYNLIDNAYRHGNGDVAIHTAMVAGQVTLTVANPVALDDEGTGLMRAFKEQGSGKTAGLGLSIVRRFAEVHAAELHEITVNGVREYRLVFGIGQPET